MIRMRNSNVVCNNHILMIATVPLLKLITLTLAGMFLVRHRILPRAAFRLLSNLVFALFLPCLIFVQLGSSITLTSIVHWWFVPFNVLLSTALGCLLGYVVVLICRPPNEFRRLIVIMTGFGNTGSLPIAIVSTVCDSSERYFGESCEREGIAYIAFAQWVSVLLVYTLVYHMMEPHEESEEYVVAGEDGRGVSTPLLQDAEWPGLHNMEMEQSRKPLIFRVFHSIINSSSKNNINFPDPELITTTTILTNESPRLQSMRCLAEEPRMVRKLRAVANQTPIRHILQPPTIASLLAITVGLVPTFRRAFFAFEAPLGFISDSLEILAEGVLPFVMLLLGSMLADGPSESGLGAKTIVGVTTARLVVMPLVGMGVVGVGGWLGFLEGNGEGVMMYRFVLALQYMTPSAILLGAIAALRGYAVNEASVLLFWQHVFGVLSLSFYIVVYFKLLA